jgi:hypothetical protein
VTAFYANLFGPVYRGWEGFLGFHLDESGWTVRNAKTVAFTLGFINLEQAHILPPTKNGLNFSGLISIKMQSYIKNH